MSEQKYYVLLRDRNVGSLGLGGRCNGWINYNWSSELNSFTKNELQNIFDGAIYTPKEYGQVIDGHRIISKDEWINPLISLEPVEEE